MTLVQKLQAFATAIGVDIKRLTRPSSPVFTYTAGTLTRIDYSDGSYKIFTYNGSQLSQMDFSRAGTVIRKTFNYSGGALASISETTL
jgi:hypothetical protein